MEEHNKEAGGIGGLIVLYLIVGYFAHWWPFPNYEHPWWKNTEYQEVCDWQGIKCYELPVTISKDSLYVTVTFPNGGQVHGYAACHERYGGGRFCDFTDQEGSQWDILPINQ